MVYSDTDIINDTPIEKQSNTKALHRVGQFMLEKGVYFYVCVWRLFYSFENAACC